jgi:hypothetical protein
MRKITVSAFLNKFAPEPWCMIDERLKLKQAFLVLYSRMPDEVLEHLPKVITIAPLPIQDAFTVHAPTSTENDALIFVPPHYEGRDQEDNNFMLAHEFAHIVLRHHEHPRFDVWNNVQEYCNLPVERDADALAAKWGYTIPIERTVARDNLPNKE